MLMQIHGDDRAESCLRDNRLASPSFHTFFIISNLIKINFSFSSVFCAFYPGTCASLAFHLVTEVSRVRQTRGNHITRSNLQSLNIDLFFVVEPKHMQGLKDIDELLTESIFERDPLGFYPTRNKQNFLMFHIDNIDRTNPLWEFKYLVLRERFRREPAFVLLPNNRWVQTFFNRRPD